MCVFVCACNDGGDNYDYYNYEYNLQIEHIGQKCAPYAFSLYNWRPLWFLIFVQKINIKCLSYREVFLMYFTEIFGSHNWRDNILHQSPIAPLHPIYTHTQYTFLIITYRSRLLTFYLFCFVMILVELYTDFWLAI